MKLTFSIKECLTFGWHAFKARPSFFIGVSLVYIVAQFILGTLQNMLPEFIGFLVAVAGGTIVSVGFLNVYLKAHDNLTGATFRDLWNPAPFWRYLVTSIAVGVIVVIGLIFVLIPGIILGLVFSFALYLTVEKKVWTVEALKESARITRGNRWTLFVLALAIGLINLVGVLLLMIGLFVSVPVSMLASIHAYRLLAARVGAKSVEAPAPAPAPASSDTSLGADSSFE